MMNPKDDRTDPTPAVWDSDIIARTNPSLLRENETLHVRTDEIKGLPR